MSADPQRCATPEQSVLLRGGTLLTMDPALGEFDGDLLIRGSRIEAVAGHLDVVADEVVDVAGSIVMPGLVDTHVHMWQAPIRGLASGCWHREYFGLVHPLAGRYRSEDIGIADHAAGLELLLHGVTTALDFCHATNSPQHARQALDGLDRSGIRALFGFSLRDRPEAGANAYSSFAERAEDLRALREEWSAHERIGLAVALNNIDHVSPADHEREVRTARELDLISTVHSNLQEQVASSHAAGLLGEDILWVHVGAVSDAELDLLRAQGGAVVCTPEVEAGQMGITPVLNRAHQRGVPVVLGSDVPAAASGDMLAQLRITYALSRLFDSQVERSAGRSGARTPWSPTLEAADLLRMVTVDAARVLGLGEETGSLTPGKQADVLVVPTGPFGLDSASPGEHLLLQGTGRAVETVYVAGRRRVDRGELVGVDPAAVREDLARVRGWVLGTAPDARWPVVDAELRARYEAGQGRAV